MPTSMNGLHQAPLQGAPSGRLDEETILRRALLSRVVEERLLSLFSEGKLFGTVHTSIGQELTGAVLADFVRPEDTVFSNHRCHGHFLSVTDDVDGLIAELMGRVTGVSGGKGGSQHLCRNGFYSNGIQGGFVPVATGLALAHRYQKAGGVSIAFIGDGTLGEGAIYEAFNIAAKWNLPLLVVLEDNGYAQSTSKTETLAGSIVGRAEAFGLLTAQGNTWDWKNLHSTAGGLIERIRKESRPGFLYIETFRLKAHSKGDDNRPRTVVEPFEKKDTINALLEQRDERVVGWLNEAHSRVERAVERATKAPLLTYQAPESTVKTLTWKKAELVQQRVVKALNETFHQIMSEVPNSIFLGEDVKSPYGGAFKVSQGLSDVFPERVWNTPISESAIVGVGTGLAMKGFRPFVEIMFGDFMSLALDQLLNHAAKFEDMFNGQVKVDLVVRTPMGGGRGYGPTHSQTLDRHFFGIPGLRVLALNSLINPRDLYLPLARGSHGPTLVVENKLQYGEFLCGRPPEGFEIFHSDEVFPTAWLKPCSDRVDLTLLGYGGMTESLIAGAERLFVEHDLLAQVIVPSQIFPFSIAPHLDGIKRSSAVLVVEEGQEFAGFGAEVLAQLASAELDEVIRVGRLAAAPVCIPSSGHAEKQVLPSVDAIVRSSLEICR